jgi:hypothetical protein
VTDTRIDVETPSNESKTDLVEVVDLIDCVCVLEASRIPTDPASLGGTDTNGALRTLGAVSRAGTRTGGFGVGRKKLEIEGDSRR